MKLKDIGGSSLGIFLMMSGMIILSGLLFIEYQFFRQQARRMIQLQKDYRGYIQIMKHNLYLQNKKNETVKCDDGDYYVSDEIVFDESSSPCFNLVNREALYLKDSALDFGKTHNLEKVIKPLYEGNNWDTNYAQNIRQRLTPQSSSSTFKKASVRQEKVNFYPVDFILSWPIKPTQFWISSKFGPRKKGFHYGIDLAALKGTPVHAALDGVVIEASYTPKGYGKSVVIDHKKCKTRYAHLNEISVKVGQRVARAQPIGTVGKTGLVQGKNPEHLHFEVIDVFGKRINPLYILK